ncbi:MAG: ABC transporter ATP-binding protein [Bacillota bacterium]|nr:ABC transporter ATP-binding protein [Bacillota bacterium]
MKTNIMKTVALNKVYTTDGNEFRVIKDIDLEIYESDFTVIMGSSGSGKSTLLYLLSGLDSVTSGEVYFKGTRTDNLNEKKWSLFRRKNIGFVHQSMNLVPSLSIKDNVVMPGYLINKNKSKIDGKAEMLLKSMDITKISSRLPSQASGGEQQRAAVARALINDPEVLFADEPTGALNSSHGRQLLDIITGINRKGQTIVMVTHDIKAACRANRIIYLKDGQIIKDLTLDNYDASCEEEREEKIFKWLKGLGW